VATVDAREAFIAGLARLVQDALRRPDAIAPDGGQRLCPAEFGRCALARP
jgi:hypothetical protein